MIPILTYSDACYQLEQAFKQRYKAGLTVQLVGILFARPESVLAKNEVVPNLSYFHFRSANNIDFFLPGYGGYHGVTNQYRDARHILDIRSHHCLIPWYFSDMGFNEFRKEIESLTDWEYKGGTELILANAKLSKDKKTAYIDFTEAITLDLDDAKNIGNVKSIEKFFEEIFRYAEKQSGKDPTWGFRKKIAGKDVWSGLKEIILSALPKGIGEKIKKSSFMWIKKVNKR